MYFIVIFGSQPNRLESTQLAIPLPALVYRQPSFSFFTANDFILTYDYQRLQFILAYIIMLHILQILTRIIIR